jgi:hypothetical protein
VVPVTVALRPVGGAGAVLTEDVTAAGLLPLELKAVTEKV